MQSFEVYYAVLSQVAHVVYLEGEKGAETPWQLTLTTMVQGQVPR
jgi:hypothetical protein